MTRSFAFFLFSSASFSIKRLGAKSCKIHFRWMNKQFVWRLIARQNRFPRFPAKVAQKKQQVAARGRTGVISTAQITSRTEADREMCFLIGRR
jgi:hypothetical protein